MVILAEAGANCTTFMCDYVSTQFDPAHLLSELGFTLVFALFELLVIGLLWRKILKPRWTAQMHHEIDEEHGYTHCDHDTHRVKPKTRLHHHAT